MCKVRFVQQLENATKVLYFLCNISYLERKCSMLQLGNNAGGNIWNKVHIKSKTEQQPSVVKFQNIKTFIVAKNSILAKLCSVKTYSWFHHSWSNWWRMEKVKCIIYDRELKVTSITKWKLLKMCHLKRKMNFFLFRRKVMFCSQDIQVFLFLTIPWFIKSVTSWWVSEHETGCIFKHILNQNS